MTQALEPIAVSTGSVWGSRLPEAWTAPHSATALKAGCREVWASRFNLPPSVALWIRHQLAQLQDQ